MLIKFWFLIRLEILSTDIELYYAKYEMALIGKLHLCRLYTWLNFVQIFAVASFTRFAFVGFSYEINISMFVVRNEMNL